MLTLSNIYIINKADNFKERVRKYLIKTLINGRIIRKVFKDKYTKDLLIPRFINNYN
jgi:hypothetical protein